jgi:ribonuclease R
MTASRGTGYVRVPQFPQDIEVMPEDLGTALHRDTVRVEIKKRNHRERTRGKITEVTERANTIFTGTLKTHGGVVFLVPDDKKFYAQMQMRHMEKIPAENMKVAVRFLHWDSTKENPEGELIEVLGPAGVHETEMKAIIFSQGFDWQFPDQVEREAAELEKNKEAFFVEEIARRCDMRNVPTFTIDPEDAKDFDDAISIRELEGGTVELGVHIADVSAYLKKDGATDTEAQKRGTSIYLVDRTIPMLPEALSNDLCSLMPDVDRLAFSVIFTMHRDGTVLSYQIAETVIRSDKRFHYKEAQDVLDTKQGPMLKELEIANEIAHALRKERFANGSIAFDTDEIKFVLDENGKPLHAFRKEHLDTNLLIEDLMLLANRTVAEHVHRAAERDQKNYVFVYRVHDEPKPEKIEDLAVFLHALGYEFKHDHGHVTAKAINALFKEVEGKPEQDLIETAAIRSMAKAVYTTKNIGHFGLAFSFYTHFTSPIRRYPDLMVHRIIKAHLAGSPPGPRDYPYYERLCLQSSERELAAVEAERESIKLKQVEYMTAHIGEEFDGVVTGITDWGVFVEELSTMAEGLLHLRSLPQDSYTKSEHGYHLSGEITKRTFALGDKVRVRLTAANIEQKTIDWELVHNEG